MKRILGLTYGVLLISVLPLMAGFEDVVTEEPAVPKTVTVKSQVKTTPKTTAPTPPVTTTTVKSQAEVTPVPPIEPQLDVKTLKFSKEISGFGYKSWDVSLPSVNNKLKTALDAVIPLIKKIPETYKIQITGYADGIGPEEPTGDKPGNIAISRDRAQAVADYISRNYGISSDRFTISGRGSSDLKDPSSEASSVNRRVVIKFEP